VLNITSNIVGFKSLVDDLTIEHGIVSSRVALLLRSAEIKPLFLVIFKKLEKLDSFFKCFFFFLFFY
jgi:hypothetical protein